MKLIDLSRELYHRTPTHPSHPPVVMADWNTYDEIKRDGEVTEPAALFAPWRLLTSDRVPACGCVAFYPRGDGWTMIRSR